jgi:hypothetical protein
MNNHALHTEGMHIMNHASLTFMAYSSQYIRTRELYAR